jgi:predicted dehydrogenase
MYPQLNKDMLFTDYKEAISLKNTDIVVICTPNGLHVPIAIEAINQSRIILCEKPMSTSYDNSKKLFDALNNSSSLFNVAYHFKFRPEVTEFLKLRDIFGEITNFHFVSSVYIEPEKPWKLNKSQGGVWTDWACNSLSVLNAIICSNKRFDSYIIKRVNFEYYDGYDVELKADVDIVLNDILVRYL